MFGNITSTASTDPTIKVKSSDANYQAQMRWNTTGNYLEFLTRYAGTYYTNTLVLDRGNVGIGITSPAAKLDISFTGGSDSIKSASTSSTSYNSSKFYNDNSKGWHNLVYGSAYSGGSLLNVGADGAIIYGNTTSGITTLGAFNLLFGTNNTPRMTIDSSGRVLIGTQTEGQANADDLTIAGTGADVGMTIRSDSDRGGKIFFSDATGGAGEYAGYIIYDHSDNSMLLGTNTTDSLKIDSSGRVGIGTDNPSAGIHVKHGSITTSSDYSSFLSNATAKIVANHSSEYGISIGYANASTDTIGIQSGNTAASRPLSLQPFGGNVGIGTDPAVLLDLDAGTTTDIRIRGNKTVNGRLGGIAFYNTSASDVIAAINVDRDGANDAGAITFDTQPASGGNTERMRIDSSGNVLINNSSNRIGERLNVTGSGILIEQTDGGIATMLGAFGSSDVILGAFSNNDVQLRTNNISRMRITSGGAIHLSQGTGNSFIGTNAGNLGTSTGTYNTGFGSNSLASLTSGNYNTANGYASLYSNTTGYENTSNGYGALYTNTTGYQNTGNGYAALNYNTTGSQNTANGHASLYFNTTGSENTAVGRSASHSTTTGGGNTSVGFNALYYNSTGNYNTTVGLSAGNLITTGNNNTVLGYNAQASSGTVSNEITLGDANVTSLRCNTQTISSLSDARDKTNVEDLPLGLDFVDALRPVKFDWDRRDGTMSGVKDAGFIAQELDEAQSQYGCEDYLGLVYKNNPEKLEASYGKLVPVLVKAIQELKAEVESLKQQIS